VKEEGYSSILKSSLLCPCLRVISRLQLCPQFIFQLNHENDVIWDVLDGRTHDGHGTS